MWKLVDIKLPDGSIVQKEMIVCEGYPPGSWTTHINVFVDPNAPKRKRKKLMLEQTEMDLDDPRRGKKHA